MNKSERILEGMLDFLRDPEHWTQANYVNGGKLCLAGAHGVVSCNNPWFWLNDQGYRKSASFNTLAEVIREQFPERGSKDLNIRATVTIFNDHKDTTHEDVILVLEKALARMEEG